MIRICLAHPSVILLHDFFGHLVQALFTLFWSTLQFPSVRIPQLPAELALSPPNISDLTDVTPRHLIQVLLHRRHLRQHVSRRARSSSEDCSRQNLSSRLTLEFSGFVGNLLASGLLDLFKELGRVWHLTALDSSSNPSTEFFLVLEERPYCVICFSMATVTQNKYYSPQSKDSTLKTPCCFFSRGVLNSFSSNLLSCSTSSKLAYTPFSVIHCLSIAFRRLYIMPDIRCGWGYNRGSGGLERLGFR